MKQSNTHRALYDAVSQIDPILIEEATAPKKTLPAVKKIAAMAAVLALLLTMFFWPNREEGYITAPGLIKVYAHELDDSGNEIIESVALEKGVVLTPEYVFRTDTSYRPQFPIFFEVEHEKYKSEEIVLEISTNSGIFYKHRPGDLSMIGKPPIEQLLYHYYGQHFSVTADQPFCWEPDGFDYAFMKEQYAKGNTDFSEVYKLIGFEENPSYFDIIMWADGEIIGYCIIEVNRFETDISQYAHRFSFEVVAMVGFPMVDGKLQNVSYEYVQKQIQLIHDTAEGQ